MAVLLLTGCASQPSHPSTVPAAQQASGLASTPALSPTTKPALPLPTISTLPTVTMPASPSVLSLVATRPPALDCDTGKLSARFIGGGYGGGSDFGAIVVWNSGPRSCQLRGSVGFAAYYPGGIRDPNARMVRSMTSGLVRLPPFMLAPRNGQDLSDYLVAYLMGLERDDASQPNALCRKQDELHPSRLVLTIGSETLPVTNLDPSSVQVTSIYGCHGWVLLEDLQAPN